MAKEIKFRQSNHLTKARYDFSLHEKRIIYHTIRALQGQINAGVTEDLFNHHLEVFISSNTIKTTDPNDNMARDYKIASKSLRKRDIQIKSPHEGGWIDTGFINYAQFDPKKGLTVEVSKFVLPYLYDLTKGFTSLSALTVFTLKSKYSQRFYEWCCQWRVPPQGMPYGWFEFTPDKLNEALAIEKPSMWLKQHVIEPARKEILGIFQAGQCDVCFDYTEERSGRGRGGKIHKWRFRVFSKEVTKQAQEDFTKLSYPKVFTLLNTAFGEKQRDLSSKIYDQLLRKNLIEDFASRVDDILADFEGGKIKNLGGYVRSTIVDRYGINS
jgi:plasmid replication initiation protein